MMAENYQIQVKIHELQNNLKTKPSDNFRKQFIGRVRIVDVNDFQENVNYDNVNYSYIVCIFISYI
jgi:hypothetical protein